MALFVVRATFARMGTVGTQLGRHQGPLCSSKMGAVAPIQVATLKATYGDKFPYEKPYPYKTSKYTFLHEWFDRTDKRMNENSKIIIVEGNNSIGKNEFARRLAKNFDLYFIPSLDMEDAWRHDENSFDLRELNEVLPESAKYYDLKKLYTDEKYAMSGRFGKTQLEIFRKKYLMYAHALHHLFSTGQGAVIARSAYSDHVYAEAMRQMGYITRNCLNYYYDVRNAAIVELLKPHITIYLDAPMETIKDRVKQKGIPYEQNSPIMTDNYLQTIDRIYKNNFIPTMRESGEVLEIDWAEVADDMDMDVIVEEIQRLTLETDDREDTHFHDWYRLTEDEMCHYRKVFGSQFQLGQWFMNEGPVYCPELEVTEDDKPLMDRIFREHPAIIHEPGWSNKLGHKPFFRM